MHEFATRRPNKMLSIAPELMNRRDEIKKVILLTFVLAFLMGLAINIMTTWIQNCLVAQIVLCVLALSAIAICLYYVLKKYVGEIENKIFFEMVVPLLRQQDLKVPFKEKCYKPIEEMELRVREIGEKDTREINILKKNWTEFIKKNRTIDDKDKPSPLLKFLIDLAEYLIFNTLEDFTRKSTTGSARFMVYGWNRPNYTTDILKQSDELSPIKNNLIFRHLPDSIPQSIKFLKGFVFKRKPMEHQYKDDAPYFEFIKPDAGAIRFTISPFPIIMSDESRDKNLISRYCDTPLEDFVLFKIPFLLSIRFKGFKMINKSFLQEYAPWIEDLVDAINNNLDWQHCAQHDMERMVVEMYRNMKVTTH